MSSKYRIREILRYVRFYTKIKLRETAKRIFGLLGMRRRKEHGASSRPKATPDKAAR